MAPTPAELAAMRQAIALSAFGLGTTSPNPPVGCVILDRDGQLVGAGYHQCKGEPHAEVHALAAAGQKAHRGTAVVTLEPCNHIGATPACRQTLLDAGIARVLIAVLDPTSRGEGGATVLAAAGVEVEVGVLTDEALLVLQPWLTATLRKRPFVTWAYTATDVADLYSATLAGLRPGVDVVLADGSVEEGVPGGHGQGRLRLPSFVPDPTDMRAFLDAVWEGGGRTILVAGDTPAARALLASDAVDRVIVDLPRTDSPRPAPVASELLSGFQLVDFTAERDTVRIHARRRHRHESP